MLTRIVDPVVEALAEDLKVVELDNATLNLVTAGPISNSAAVVADFTTWGTGAPVVWGGPYVDAGGNFFLSAPGAEFANAGTTNVAVIGAIGTTGTGTTLALKFQFQFDAPVNIGPGGNLSVPVKIVVPLTQAVVPNPTL